MSRTINLHHIQLPQHPPLFLWRSLDLQHLSQVDIASQRRLSPELQIIQFIFHRRWPRGDVAWLLLHIGWLMESFQT